MPPANSPDRRLFRRRTIIESQLLTVDFLLRNGQEHRHRGIVIDMSEGGLALQPFRPLEPGSAGELRLELPGCKQPFAGTGTVAWVGQGGRAGIRFLDVEPEVRGLLREWLETSAEPKKPLTVLLASAVPATVPIPEKQTADELDLGSALQLIAERARTVTGAAGAAIAIGDSQAMVCRASIGVAPDVGAVLRPDAGLTGECLRTAKVVHCPDTQADARVDAAVARRLNLRSVMVMPVLSGERLTGIVEVLSPQRMAFAERHQARLERIAELLSAAMSELQREAGEKQAAAKVPAPAAASEAVSLPSTPPPPQATIPTATPEVASKAGLASAAPVLAPQSPTSPAMPTPAQDETAVQAPELPMPLFQPAEMAEVPAVPAARSKAAAVTEPGIPLASYEFEEGAASARRLVLPLVIAAVAIAILLLAGWYLVHARKVAQDAFTVPVPVTKPVEQPAAPVQPPPQAQPTPVVVPPPPSKPPAKNAAPPKPAAEAQRLTMWPEARVRLPGGKQESAETPPELMPQLPIDTDITAVLTGVSAATPRLKPESTRTAQFVPGKLVHRVEPVYPRTAVASDAGGTVVLSAKVTKKGTVENVKVVRGSELLARAAVDAVRQWRYQPYRLDGQPVEVETTITIHFNPRK